MVTAGHQSGPTLDVDDWINQRDHRITNLIGTMQDSRCEKVLNIMLACGLNPQTIDVMFAIVDYQENSD